MSFPIPYLEQQRVVFSLTQEWRGIEHYGLFDLGIFLRGSARSGALIINEELGAFRRSGSQVSSQTQSPTFRASILAWAALGSAAHNQGKLNDSEYRHCCLRSLGLLNHHFANDAKAREVIALHRLLKSGEVREFKARFLALWPGFLEHVVT
ncbi:MAG: hypothetical protein AAGI11_10715 [Pseudomonadota bacterium]